MKDLGTYHVKVEIENERGFIYTVNTGSRYERGDVDVSPIDAGRSKPTFKSEQEIIDTMVFMFTEGNYSCDCNLRDFIDRAYNQECKDHDCGDDLIVSKLTLVRPEGYGFECVIYER